MRASFSRSRTPPSSTVTVSLPPPYRFVAVAALVSSTMLSDGAAAQTFTNSTGQTAAGALLGAYSGATLGLVGSMFPCGRTHEGQRCVVSAASVGAALGVAMGGLIGSQDREGLDERLRSAGWGVAAGSVAGLAVAAVVDRFGIYDAATIAWVGGAVGASPRGAAIGTGIGATAGLLTWLALPDSGPQDLVLFTLAGTALGGMLDWADGAASKPTRTVSASFSVATW